MDEKEYIKNLSENWKDFFNTEEGGIRAAIAWELHELNKILKSGLVINKKV